MKVLVVVKASPESEAGVMPSEQLLTEMGKYNEELVKAGIMLSGEGLHPSSKGARVRFSGKNRTVMDGPFAETKELIAGFWLWQVKSLEEAIEWVKRCPNPMESDSDIEIRPIFEMEDFGEALTPELREQEERIRAATEKLTSQAGSSSTACQLEPPRFEQGKQLLIAGLSARYTMETRRNIPALWQRFAPHMGTISGQVGNTAYGVSSNVDQDCHFDYLCGVEVLEANGLPDGFTYLRIPAQRYAVFTHCGHVSAIPNAFQAIWEQWLPNSGYQMAGTPCFERYTDDFDPHSGLGGMEIWIPIKA